LLLLLLFATSVYAQECRAVTSEINFGDYDVLLKAPRDATGKVTVVCDGAFPFTVKLDKGLNSRGSFNPRVMRAPAAAESLNYNLYTDSTRQNIWGDGTGNTFVNTGIADRVQNHITVYGRIPGGQKVPAGVYTDRINVTVEW
jgi:spore coat protein U-like protein